MVALATTADPVSLEALRPAAREIVTAAVAGDLIAYVEADTRFHLGLLALAGNAHLVEVVRDLRWPGPPSTASPRSPPPAACWPPPRNTWDFSTPCWPATSGPCAR
ncbi:hypothetical protein SMICM17S_01726 [Streptomyces microflavus]